MTTILEVSAPVAWNVIKGVSVEARAIAHVLCDAYTQNQRAELLFFEQNDLRFWLDVLDEIAATESSDLVLGGNLLDPRRVMANAEVCCFYRCEELRTKACVAAALHIWYEGRARAAKWSDCGSGDSDQL